MAIAHVASSGTAEAGGQAFIESPAFSATGSAKYLIASVAVAAGTPPTYSSCKWGGSSGTTMTSIGEQRSGGNQYQRLGQFGLALGASDTGSLTIYATLSGNADELVIGGSIYSDVHQSTPTGTQAKASGNVSGPATVNVSSATGEMVVDGVATNATTISVGASQTPRNEDDSVQSVWAFGTSEEAGAATVTMSWTVPTNDWAIVGVPLKPYVAPTAAVTGTATSSITEADIVTGGKTVVLTLTDDTYVSNAAGTWSYVASGTASNGNNAASVAPGLPSGWAVGDLHILVFSNYGGTDSRTPAAPSGWTSIPSATNYTQNGTTSFAVYYRVAEAGDSAPTVTLSGTGATNDTQLSQIHGFRGSAGYTIALDTNGSSVSTNTSADSVGPIAGITPTAGALLLLIGAKSNDWNGTATDSTYTLAAQNESTTGTDAGNALLYQLSAAGSATGDQTITDSGATASNGVGLGIMASFKFSATAFENQRAAIRNGLDSAQSEAAGWDAKVKGNIPVANVVRTSNTVCTITLQAQSDYNITATETITATIPAAALAGGAQIVASPTFTVAAGSAGYTVTSTAGSATAAGVSATLKRDKLITSTAGAITLAGVSATLTRNYVVTSTAGAITLTGVAATLLKTRLITSTAGAATATGASATLTRNYVVAATAGAAAAEGVAGTLSRSYTTTATAGAITLAGAEATLLKSRVIVSTAGSATAAGVEATLTWEAPPTGYVVTSTAGSATAAGAEATLKRTRLITATGGSIALEGAAATLTRSYVITSTAGAITLTGAEATLTRSYVVTSTEGAIVAAGLEATLTYTPVVTGYTITAYPGLIDLSGAAATLTYTDTATPAQFVGAVGRGRSRVMVRIENGQVYEVKDEPEARKVVKTIKRKVERQLRRAERESLPLIEIPAIEITGAAPFVESLRREVEDVRVHWSSLARRVWQDRDEDDVEALLL